MWLNPPCTSQNKLHGLDLELFFKRIHHPLRISLVVRLRYWSAASAIHIIAPVRGAGVAPEWHSRHCLVTGLLQRVSCQEGWLCHCRACHGHAQQHPCIPCIPCSAAAARVLSALSSAECSQPLLGVKEGPAASPSSPVGRNGRQKGVRKEADSDFVAN